VFKFTIVNIKQSGFQIKLRFKVLKKNGQIDSYRTASFRQKEGKHYLKAFTDNAGTNCKKTVS